MLKKLLKYDLKNIIKYLFIFYSLSIIFAILTRIFLNIENSLIFNVIGKICSGATIAMIFNIIINNIIRLWVRFKENLYGDESYLTHTLPVTKSEIYISKIINSIITLFTSTVIIALTLFIAYYSKENLELIKNLLLPVANIYNSSIISILLAFLFILFIEFANMLQAGYTGIILGHKMDNNKILCSIVYGFATYTLTQTLVLVVMFISALFDKGIMNLFFTTEIVDFGMMKLIFYIATIAYILNLIIIYIVNLKLFKKGVNVD